MISSTTWVAARVDSNVTPMREKHIFFIVSGGRHGRPSVGRNGEASSYLTPLFYFTWRKHQRPGVEPSTRRDDRKEPDQGLRIKARAVASSITGRSHINSATALRMEEHISSALLAGASRRRAFTSPTPNSGSRRLSSFSSHSPSPRDSTS